MKRLLYGLLSAVLFILTAAALLILIIEWMSGCGETYVDAKGVRHHYECIIIPQKPAVPTYHNSVNTTKE